MLFFKFRNVNMCLYYNVIVYILLIIYIIIVYIYMSIYYYIVLIMGFPGVSGVNNLPARQETRVQSLGWEDPLKKGMATHSSILA